jgi:hypothetical protein
MLKGDKPATSSGRRSRERSPLDDATQAWRDNVDAVAAREASSSAAQNDFGITTLDEEEEPDEDVESGRYKTYFPKKKRQLPGHFDGAESDAQSTDEEGEA